MVFTVCIFSLIPLEVTAKLAGTNKLQPIVRHCFTTPQTDSLIYPEVCKIYNGLATNLLILVVFNAVT